MIQIKNAKLAKIGNSYFIRVPKAFIVNGMMDIQKEYEIEIKEGEEVEKRDRVATD